MSNWTHVAEIIRVDCFGDNLVDQINDIIGKEIHFNSSRDEWKDFDKNPDKFDEYREQKYGRKNVV